MTLGPVRQAATTPSGTACPSTMTNCMPRPALPGSPHEFGTSRTQKIGHIISRPARGIQGSNRSVSPDGRRPRIASRATRYSQPAEPVYQVQPPRPVRRSAVDIAATT